jgi:hypothetical protein
MPLNWNMENVKDVGALHNTGANAAPKGSTEDVIGDVEWAISNSLIWATLYIGLDIIKESNLDEWEFRLTMHQLLHGSMLNTGTGAGVYITREHLERRVGLYTNAGSMTRAAFIKRTTTGGSNTSILRHRLEDLAKQEMIRHIEKLNEIEQREAATA